MKLYELAAEEEKIQYLIETLETEEDQDTILQLMDELNAQIEHKSAGMIKVVRNINQNIECVKNEIRRLNEFKASLERKEDSLKKYVKYCMEKMEIKKIETELGAISLRKSPAKLNIITEDNIPDNFIVKKEVVSIDKTALKKAVKNGLDVNGVELQENNYSIIIK